MKRTTEEAKGAKVVRSRTSSPLVVATGVKVSVDAEERNREILSK
ncbi:hypothetical protein [Chroogloeocystis siderophila]|nr:hypothetical protein [Chroogloeocystis siderophila]